MNMDRRREVDVTWKTDTHSKSCYSTTFSIRQEAILPKKPQHSTSSPTFIGRAASQTARPGRGVPLTAACLPAHPASHLLAKTTHLPVPHTRILSYTRDRRRSIDEGLSDPARAAQEVCHVDDALSRVGLCVCGHCARNPRGGPQCKGSGKAPPLRRVGLPQARLEPAAQGGLFSRPTRV